MEKLDGLFLYISCVLTGVNQNKKKLYSISILHLRQRSYKSTTTITKHIKKKSQM